MLPEGMKRKYMFLTKKSSFSLMLPFIFATGNGSNFYM